MNGSLLAVSSNGRGCKGALRGAFHKGTNLIMRAPLSWPNHFPKAPPPNTITLGVRTSAYEFGWGGHNLVCSFGGSLEFHESQGTSGGDQGNVLFGRRNLQESQTCRVAFIKLDPWTQAGLGTP